MSKGATKVEVEGEPYTVVTNEFVNLAKGSRSTGLSLNTLKQADCRKNL